MKKTTTRTARVSAKLAFTEDERRTIRDAAEDVWNEIGYDVLQGIAEWGGPRPRDINRVTISRSHVIELVLDASRTEEKLDAGLRARVQATDYATLIEIVKPAFPSARYGL